MMYYVPFGSQPHLGTVVMLCAVLIAYLLTFWGKR